TPRRVEERATGRIGAPAVLPHRGLPFYCQRAAGRCDDGARGRRGRLSSQRTPRPKLSMSPTCRVSWSSLERARSDDLCPTVRARALRDVQPRRLAAALQLSCCHDIATAVSSGNAIVLFTGTFYGPNWASLEPARTFERTLKIVTIVTNVWKFDVCWSSPRDPRGQAYASRTRHCRLP